MKLKGSIYFEDGFYQIAFDVINVFTFGKDVFEALNNAKEAAGLMLESFTNGAFGANTINVIVISESIIEMECSATKEFAQMILKQLRGSLNMSLKEVSKKSGKKSHNSIAQYEYGKNEPSLSNFEAVLHAMGYEMSIELKKNCL